MREILERDGIEAVAVAGYSLGGNLALKLAGDLGDAAPSQLEAVCAVSPTMDLARCVEALERPANFAYQWNFVRNLKARMRRKIAACPGMFAAEPLRDIRTVRQFDEAYTAPHHGFRDAADYYHRASALRVVHRIQVPALILAAEDDPFVPSTPFRDPAVMGNPNITVAITPHGGHCAYLERAGAGYDGYWAEREIVRFLEARRRRRVEAGCRTHAADHLQLGPAPDARSASARTPAPSLTLRA
jgi:predicted alpha/beta-fold hydrolase